MLSYYILFTILGLIVGSFLNVVIFRMDELKSILNTRSRCNKCKKIIKWYDLVPLLSFILLKGSCRYCKEKISWQYPIVEGATGLLFFLLTYFFGVSYDLLFYIIFFSIMIVIFVYDLKTQFVPEYFAWVGLLLAIFGGWFFGANPSFGSMLLGLVVAGGFIGLMVMVSRERWMGSGDIKIAAALGAIVGYPNVILFIFMAFVLGSLVGIFTIVNKQKKLKDSLPFAPFLVLSSIITLFWGNQIVSWYLGILNF